MIICASNKMPKTRNWTKSNTSQHTNIASSTTKTRLDGDDDDDDGRNKHVRTETPARRNKNHKLETALEGISQVFDFALATIT